MGTRDSSNLKIRTEGVKKALAGLDANLRKSPYKDNAVKSLHPAVIGLCDLIRAELSNRPHHPLERGVRQALSTLRSVEGSMQLLITASRDYAGTQDIDEKHTIEERWMSRRNKLADEADLCVQSLDPVLAFAEDLDPGTVNSEPGDETRAG